MSTTEQRKRIREALMALGFKHRHATHDGGSGQYAESWENPGGDLIITSWAERTDKPTKPDAPEVKVGRGGDSKPRQSDSAHCFSSSATLFRCRASGLTTALLDTLIILSGRGFDLCRAEYLAGRLPSCAGTTGQQHTNHAQSG